MFVMPKMLAIPYVLIVGFSVINYWDILFQMATVGTISAVFVIALMLQCSAQIVNEGNDTSDGLNTTTPVEMAGVFAPPIDIQDSKRQEIRLADGNNIGQPGQRRDGTSDDNNDNNDHGGGKGSSFDTKIDTDGDMLRQRSAHCMFQEGCTLVQPQTDSAGSIQTNVNSTAPVHVILRGDANTVPASDEQIPDNGRESVTGTYCSHFSILAKRKLVKKLESKHVLYGKNL